MRHSAAEPRYLLMYSLSWPIIAYVDCVPGPVVTDALFDASDRVPDVPLSHAVGVMSLQMLKRVYPSGFA